MSNPLPILHYIRDNSFLSSLLERGDIGWGNGYVGVPPGHPWHGKHYYNIDADVHGGLTYSQDHAPLSMGESPVPDSEGYWWVGFDTCHLHDNKDNWPESHVKNETLRLAKQAEEAQDQQDYLNIERDLE